jgi:flagellar hook-length control protein FliK
MNPVSAPMPPAMMLMMSGPTPTTGVFEDMLNISVTLPDAPPSLPVDVVPCATAPICTPDIMPVTPFLPAAENWGAADILVPATAPEAQNRAVTIVLPQATTPEAQNQTANIVLPQANAPANSIEDVGIVAAEKVDASSPPIDLALVSALMVQMRPPVSAPAYMPAPQIAPQALTPSVAGAALVPTPRVKMRPLVNAPAPMPVTPLAPQVRKLANRTKTPKPLDATPPQTLAQTPAQWLPSAPQDPVKRADAMPTVRPVAIPTPLLIKENKPQLPRPLPAHNLGLVDDPLFSFEPQSGIRATVVSVAPTAPPTGTPIAELRQLVITADGEWIGALARDIVSHAAHDNQLAFTLIPEHLGQLDVAVSTDNGQVDIWLETSTQAAAQAISAEQARLIEDLRQAGLKLGQFDMSNRQNGNGQQPAQRHDSQHSDNDSTPAQAKAFSKAQGRFA